ncbi:MAG: hypothetical protein KGL44_09095 [Sphingomonadales bacterium]|nr:hypothetical protein [Sphingomonadales bacterium]
MGDIAKIGHRAAFTAQALATMGADPEWDRALTKFLTCEARARAQEEYGEWAQRNEAIVRSFALLEHRFGKDWKRHPDAAAEAAQLNADSRASDDRLQVGYFAPFWASQQELMTTPAPTLAAALFKAAMIELHDVWNAGEDDLAGFAIIEADLSRFTGEA